jgi:Coenzyme PQQ synthesis protein D (PqqD)
MTLTSDTILVRDSEPVAATIDGDVVLLSVRAGSYFGLNAVGTEIWDLLAESRRVGDIVDRLSQSYDVDRDTMTRDVTTFLNSLIERRLLRVVKPGKAP